MIEPPTPAPPAPGSTGAAYGLVLVLAALLAVWGAFLLPFRIAGELVPVSWALALVGNLLLGRAGDRLLGPAGAAGPGVVWIVVVLVLSWPRSEGDLVLPPNTVVGLLFLLVGVLTSAAVFGGAVGRAARGPAAGAADR